MCAVSSDLVQLQDSHPHEITKQEHGHSEILYLYTVCSTYKLIFLESRARKGHTYSESKDSLWLKILRAHFFSAGS